MAEFCTLVRHPVTGLLYASSEEWRWPAYALLHGDEMHFHLILPDREVGVLHEFGLAASAVPRGSDAYRNRRGETTIHAAVPPDDPAWTTPPAKPLSAPPAEEDDDVAI